MYVVWSVADRPHAHTHSNVMSPLSFMPLFGWCECRFGDVRRPAFYFHYHHLCYRYDYPPLSCALFHGHYFVNWTGQSPIRIHHLEHVCTLYRTEYLVQRRPRQTGPNERPACVLSLRSLHAEPCRTRTCEVRGRPNGRP